MTILTIFSSNAFLIHFYLYVAQKKINVVKYKEWQQPSVYIIFLLSFN